MCPSTKRQLQPPRWRGRMYSFSHAPTGQWGSQNWSPSPMSTHCAGCATCVIRTLVGVEYCQPME